MTRTRGPGRPAQGLAAERRRGPARRPGRRPLRQAPPAELRRVRRVPLLRPRHARCTVVRVHGVDVAIAICEDLWQEGGPVAATRRGRRRPAASCINGSPYERNKDDVRLELARRRAARGRLRARLRQHGRRPGRAGLRRRLARRRRRRRACSPARRSSSEELLVVDLDLPRGRRRDADDRAEPEVGVTSTIVVLRRSRCAPYDAEPAADRDAGSTTRPRSTARWSPGLRDYVRKNGFRTVVLGLSGGIDSALVAAHRRATRSARENVLRRLDAERVLLASTPGPTPPTWPSAPACTSDVVPIAPMVDAFRRRRWSSTGARRGEPAGPGPRRSTLMALSNQHGHLVLATGNKSELAVGYSTIYGDAVGGFAPIKDVPKTLVWRARPLAQRRAPSAAARHRRSRRRRSPSRRRPSCARASSTPTRCPPYERARRHPRRLRRAATAASPSWSRPASTPSWSSGCCAWSTARSTSAGSTRRARRSVSRRSAATAGCRSRTAGGSTLTGPGDAPAARRGTMAGVRGLAPGSLEDSRRIRHGRPRTRRRPRRYGAGRARTAGPIQRVRDPPPARDEGARRALRRCSPPTTSFTAEIFDEAGIPVLLVGDSAANNVLGYDTDVAGDRRRAAAAGARRHPRRHAARWSWPTCRSAPTSRRPQQALETSVRFMKEGGAHAVKLEGGARVAAAGRARSSTAGIPVMAPHRVHAAERARARRLPRAGPRRAGRRGWCDDALALEEAGAFAVVLEMVPADVAARVTAELAIPTIGIGAGRRLRRPGAGLAGHGRAAVRSDAALRQAVRRPARRAGQGHARLRRRRRARQLPDAEHSYR